MNKTLITRLKGVVNNDNILKLGEIRLSFNGNRQGDQQFGAIYKTSDSVMNVVGYTGGVYKNSDKSIKLEEIQSGFENINFYYTNNTKFGIMPKYGITGLTLTNLSDIHGGLVALNGLTNLSKLTITDSSISDDMSNLDADLTYLSLDKIDNLHIPTASIAKFKNLKDVTIHSSTAFVGNVKELGVLTKLENMNIDSCFSLLGSIEDFVKVQRANGKTANSTGIVCGYMSGLQITFNGNKFTGAYDKKITWTDSTITVSNKNGSESVTVNA